MAPSNTYRTYHQEATTAPVPKDTLATALLVCPYAAMDARMARACIRTNRVLGGSVCVCRGGLDLIARSVTCYIQFVLVMHLVSQLPPLLLQLRPRLLLQQIFKWLPHNAPAIVDMQATHQFYAVQSVIRAYMVFVLHPMFALVMRAGWGLIAINARRAIVIAAAVQLACQTYWGFLSECAMTATLVMVLYARLYVHHVSTAYV